MTSPPDALSTPPARDAAREGLRQPPALCYASLLPQPVLALLLAALFTLAPQDTTETPSILDAPTISRGDSGRSVVVRPRLAPSAIYSQSRGFGIAGGVAVDNLITDGTELALDLRLSQRFQGVALSAFSADRYSAPVYGFASVEASTTSRRRFFGIGPYTDDQNKLFLDYTSLDAEARVGAYPLGHTGLFLQPGARFLLDYLRELEEDQGISIDTLRLSDPASLASVEADDVLDNTRYGVSVGLEIASDLRDWRAYPRRGTFVSVEGRRFFALDGSGLQYDRLAVSTLGYLPIRGRTALIGRSNLVLTRSDNNDPIPFYYLPVLDTRLLTAYSSDRFVGRDVLAVGGGVRVPIADFIGVYGIDAVVMGYLGNVYDNVFEQFEPGLTFDQGAIPRDGGVPLRPALGIGVGIVNLDKERVVLGGLLGISPGRISVASLRIAYDLRDARPLFR